MLSPRIFTRLTSPELYFQSDVGRRAASSWALLHISSFFGVGRWEGKFFTGVCAELTRRFLHRRIPSWQMDTGSSYNFPTDNDINVISAAAAKFYDTLDPFPPVSFGIVPHRRAVSGKNQK